MRTEVITNRLIDVMLLPSTLATGRHWTLKLIAMMVQIPWLFCVVVLSFPVLVFVLLREVWRSME